MTDKDVLTQEEIDALLSGVQEGSVDMDPADEQANVSAYDLTNQDRVVHGRLPGLELVAERFIRRIRVTLPAYLKVPLEVGSGGVQVIKYSEYAESLYVPTYINLLKIAPLAGTSLLTLDAKLIHHIVDRFFGGIGEISAFERKEFTRTERKVIGRMVQLLLADFASAWQEIMPVSCEVVGDEVNPSLLNVIAPGDAVMVTSYRLDLPDGGGELHFAFPYAALEPFKRILDVSAKQENEGGDEAWRAALERTLLDVEVPLNCLIGEAELRLRTLLRLTPGDELDLDMGELHQVSVDHLPLFTATLGNSRGKLALEFNDFGQGR